MSEWPAVAFDDVMATTHFDVHDRPHIVVNGEVCRDSVRTSATAAAGMLERPWHPIRS